MTVALVSAIVGLVTLVAVLAYVLAARRGRDSPDERIAEVVRELNARMDGMARELTDALERSHEEGRFNRFLGELAGSIDLDEVLTRVLEAAGAIPGADAALVVVKAPNGKPIVATLGLSAEEAERQAVAGPPDGRQVRAIKIAYEYPPSEIDAHAEPIRGGIAVPVPGDGDTVGMLTIFSRANSPAYGDEHTKELEELALRAGPAIENARRFREARQLADLDALTGLHNRRYFHETLAREVARAQRYDRRLALIIFDLDDFKAINDKIGHLSGDSVLAEAAERVREVVRSADVACRVGGDEFAVILPESANTDADQLYRRLQAAVSARPIGQAGKLTLSAGIAELRPTDDSRTFFERADEALYAAKEAGKGQARAAKEAEGLPEQASGESASDKPPPDSA